MQLLNILAFRTVPLVDMVEKMLLEQFIVSFSNIYLCGRIDIFTAVLRNDNFVRDRLLALTSKKLLTLCLSMSPWKATSNSGSSNINAFYIL